MLECIVQFVILRVLKKVLNPGHFLNPPYLMCLKMLITATGVALAVLLITKLLIQSARFAEVLVMLDLTPPAALSEKLLIQQVYRLLLCS